MRSFQDKDNSQNHVNNSNNITNQSMKNWNMINTIGIIFEIMFMTSLHVFFFTHKPTALKDVITPTFRIFELSFHVVYIVESLSSGRKIIKFNHETFHCKHIMKRWVPWRCLLYQSKRFWSV